jgi:GTPase SAR1 family protein
LHKTLRGIRSPAIVPKGNKRNSIILIGLGGTGKTTLIKALTGHPSIEPDKKTDQYAIYRSFIANPDNTNKKADGCWYYISDYRGQNIGELIGAFISQQFSQYSPMAYGFINTLILIVDLLPYTNIRDGKTFDKPDDQRITEQLNEWNETALSAVFGLLTYESLTVICLYINKLDLLGPQSQDDKERYKKSFLDLIERIEKRRKAIEKVKKEKGLAGPELHIILGSVRDGAGIPELNDILRRYSV